MMMFFVFRHVVFVLGARGFVAGTLFLYKTNMARFLNYARHVKTTRTIIFKNTAEKVCSSKFGRRFCFVGVRSSFQFPIFTGIFLCDEEMRTSTVCTLPATRCERAVRPPLHPL